MWPNGEEEQDDARDGHQRLLADGGPPESAEAGETHRRGDGFGCGGHSVRDTLANPTPDY